MTRRPEVLVMDLGGVTCRWLPDRRLAELAERTGLPAATVDAQVFESGLDDAAERGQFALDELVGDLAAVLGLDEDDPATGTALRGLWARAFEPDDRVVRLVERARRTTPTALFTNNGPLLEAALAHELADVGAVFDRIVCSWRLGATKPDPEAFDRATAALGVEPGAVLFVDDSAANVAAAQEQGWQAHHFRDSLNLQAALTQAGLLG